MADAINTVTMERTFQAPRELVFKAWTDPQLVAQWWGPNGVTNPTCEWEAKPGGKIHIIMLAGPELGPMAGQEWPMTGVMEDVTPPEKLVFTANAIADDKVILENRTTVTFAIEGDTTKLTVQVTVTSVAPAGQFALQGMDIGWNQQLDKLVNFIAVR